MPVLLLSAAVSTEQVLVCDQPAYSQLNSMFGLHKLCLCQLLSQVHISGKDSRQDNAIVFVTLRVHVSMH